MYSPVPIEKDSFSLPPNICATAPTGIMEPAPASISWEVLAFSLFRVLIFAVAVEQSTDLARFACTSFCGAGAGEEQPANSATKITIDVSLVSG